MSVYAVSVLGESFPHSTQVRCVPSSGISLGDGGGSDLRGELTLLLADTELSPATASPRLLRLPPPGGMVLLRFGLSTLPGAIEPLRFGASDVRFESCLLPGVFELPPVMICRTNPPPLQRRFATPCDAGK
jgi:hypothetical protein